MSGSAFDIGRAFMGRGSSTSTACYQGGVSTLANPKPIEGTILLDWGCPSDRQGVYGGVSFDSDIDVKVGWSGEIEYANVRGKDMCWFAAEGAGSAPLPSRQVKQVPCGRAELPT